MRRNIALWAATFVAVMLLGTSARANSIIYFNGFEPGDPGAGDFYDSTTNIQGPNPGSNITVVANGGGQLGLTAATGSYYAEITNTHDTYMTGYGQSVYTSYGAVNGIPISGPFYESTSYYINTGWAAAGPDSNYVGFWIDTTPNNTYNDPFWGSYADETNFRIIATGDGDIGVTYTSATGGASTSSDIITTSGWYTFQTTFEDNGGYTANTMSVIDSLGNVIDSWTTTSDMPFADLLGTSYGDWTTVWEDGFAGDVLGIDDVTVGSLSSVPLPAVAWMLPGLLGIFGVGRKLRSRRQLV